MAKTGGVKVTKTATPTVVARVVEDADAQVFVVSDSTKLDEIEQMAAAPGVRLSFDATYMPFLDEEFVTRLPVKAQKEYWMKWGEFVRKRNLSANAEFSIGVDPRKKLLDSSMIGSNPLDKDREIVEKRLPGYYVTWRVQGGSGDYLDALSKGFKPIRRPKDDEEMEKKSPLDWSGEQWRVRDGSSDKDTGDELYNAMVVIRSDAWKDHLDAVSMISHNAYAQNKKQFIEGIDNMNRDMLSAKERVEVIDLDEQHAEEHTILHGGERVRVTPK